MHKTEYDIIILGGGVSGFGAAVTLQKNKKEFLLITENIGGRVENNNGVNYGAYFATHQYKNLKPFLHLKKELKKSDIEFHCAGKAYKIVSMRFVRVFFQYLKFAILLIKFRSRYNAFKKNCETMGQERALKKDLSLTHLYHQRASDWIQEKGVRKLVDEFISEPLYGLTFTAPSEMNAFFFLQWSSEIFLHRVFEFSIDWPLLKRTLADAIVMDSVQKIHANSSGYTIITKTKSYHCKHLISALPFWVSDTLLELKHTHVLLNAYMHHIRGTLRSEWANKRMNLFSPGSQSFVIVKQIDGTYLLYSRHKEINLDKFFEDYEIIMERVWEPAFANPHTLFSFDVKDNLTVIGDVNVPGMEDSFISGVYAANRYINKFFNNYA